MFTKVHIRFPLCLLYMKFIHSIKTDSMAIYY